MIFDRIDALEVSMRYSNNMGMNQIIGTIKIKSDRQNNMSMNLILIFHWIYKVQTLEVILRILFSFMDHLF